jgi:hypothetical protein
MYIRCCANVVHNKEGALMAGRQGRRGFGTVRRLPSGRWQAVYTDLEQKRRHAPDTFGTETEADRWLRSVRIQRSAALNRPAARSELAELADILANVSARLSALAGEG